MKPGYALTYPWLHADDTHPVVCCLCQGAHPTHDDYAFTINDHPFTIRRCVKDDLMFLHPQPGAQYCRDLYNHPSYFTGEDDMYGLSVQEEKSHEIAAVRVAEISHYQPDAKTFLEIGCAYGHTLQAAKAHGFTIADGVEFSDAAVAACRKKGLNVFLGSANHPVQRQLQEKTYDTVAAYSVLEHLQNPLEFLHSIRGSVSREGRLLVRVPRMSVDGPWLSLVDHFWHFTETSLRSLFVRSGYEVITVFPSGTFVGTRHKGELSSMTAIVKPVLTKPVNPL